MSPCESCHAGCCRSFAIPVTGADVLRIERGLNLSFAEFVCRWADPDGIIAQNYAPHLFFEDEPETPFVLALMHHESVYFPDTTKCEFLVEGQPDAEHPNGQARCGIYENRPAACRVFPVRFNETGELAVINDVPARSRDADESVYDLCPRPWEPADLDPLLPIQNLVVARHEMQFFHGIAARWNQELRPWELFPVFLQMIYENRVIKNESAAASTATPDAYDEDEDAAEDPAVFLTAGTKASSRERRQSCS